MTEYDKHGDSFTDDVTEERLHQIFNDIKDEVSFEYIKNFMQDGGDL